MSKTKLAEPLSHPAHTHNFCCSFQKKFALMLYSLTSCCISPQCIPIKAPFVNQVIIIFSSFFFFFPFRWREASYCCFHALHNMLVCASAPLPHVRYRWGWSFTGVESTTSCPGDKDYILFLFFLCSIISCCCSHFQWRSIVLHLYFTIT